MIITVDPPDSEIGIWHNAGLLFMLAAIALFYIILAVIEEDE